MGMRKLLSIVLLSGFMTVLWGADWASQSGNPQRDGWARGEEEIVKDQVQGLKLLYKTQGGQSIERPCLPDIADHLEQPHYVSRLQGDAVRGREFRQCLFH